jgi:hypothetical protein
VCSQRIQRTGLLSARPHWWVLGPVSEGRKSGLALPPTKLKLASSEWDVVSCRRSISMIVRALLT